MEGPRPARLIEGGLVGSRWLLAPFYLGLVVALFALLGVFVVELLREVAHLFETPPPRLAEAGILMALSLIDLALSANLLVLVIFSSYENFVSRIRIAPDGDTPAWMGAVDFSGLKMKLIASIVAISLVALLRTYLELDDSPPEQAKLLWRVLITVSFAFTGVLLALMDLLNSRVERR